MADSKLSQLYISNPITPTGDDLLYVVDDAAGTPTDAGTTVADVLAVQHDHTASDITDFDTEVASNSTVAANTAKNSYPSADATKLEGIATGATANSSDATLLNRTNHTGAQAISTVTGLQTALDGKSDTSHTHDDRYYTETETDTLLDAKADAADVPTTIVESVVAGTNVTVDNTDPANPVISASGGGGGGAVDSVNGATGVVVLDADDLDDTSTTNKFSTSAEKSKLAGIADGATANDTDANLKNRANHTGSQAISTVTGLQTALDGKADTSHTQAASTITDFDTEVSNNTDVAANTTARHTHSNKALLDTYTQTETNLADAVSKKHAATLVGTKTIDETDIADGKVIAYNATSGKLEYETASGGGMTNPMTTAGDVIYGGSSGTPTRLAKGTAGQVLTMNTGATAPEWATASGGGGSSATPTGIWYTGTETADQWGQGVVSGAAITFNQASTYLRMAANTTSGGRAQLYRNVGITHAMKATAMKNPQMNADARISGTAGSGNAYLDFFSSSNNASITTSSQVGYKFIKASSSVTTSASCGNGTTETATSVTGSLSAAITSGAMFNAVLTEGANIKYYEAGTLLATHTTNLPPATGADFRLYHMCLWVDNNSTTDNYVLDFTHGAIQYEMY